MSTKPEILAANHEYAAEFGERSQLALPPARRIAILTCMDARLDPAKYAGLVEGDAHVIRNAGGRASDDAIRSLVISYKLLGTKEWFVIHHTNCGMEFFTDTVMRGLLANSLETAALGEDGFYDVGTGPGSAEASYIDWLTISHTEQSVVDKILNAALDQGLNVVDTAECYVDSEGNTYDFCFGLNWSGVIDDDRVATYSAKALTQPETEVTPGDWVE